MLDVHHEAQAVVITWDGSLDEPAADRILAAFGLIRDVTVVVVDLTRATGIHDAALARLARFRELEFRGLREHQERLLKYLRQATMDTSPLEEGENIVKETTEAFCNNFAEDGDFCGSFALSVSQGALPNGVDPYDPRVIEIRRKCQESAATEYEIPFTD